MGSSIGPALPEQLSAFHEAVEISVQGVDYTASIQSNAFRCSRGREATVSVDQAALPLRPSILVTEHEQKSA